MAWSPFQGERAWPPAGLGDLYGVSKVPRRRPRPWVSASATSSALAKRSRSHRARGWDPIPRASADVSAEHLPVAASCDRTVGTRRRSARSARSRSIGRRGLGTPVEQRSRALTKAERLHLCTSIEGSRTRNMRCVSLAR